MELRLQQSGTQRGQIHYYNRTNMELRLQQSGTQRGQIHFLLQSNQYGIET